MRRIGIAKSRSRWALAALIFMQDLSLVRHGPGCGAGLAMAGVATGAEYRFEMEHLPLTMPTDAEDHDALIAALLPAVREAARLEMSHFTKGVKFEQKADRTPVTVADREAETILLSALAGIAPSVPVVAEEEIAAGAVCGYARRFFLVDALDGTRLFIRGKPEFSINVAMVEDGKPRFGLIFLPPSERLFVTRGDGLAYEGKLPLSTGRQSLDVQFKRISTREPQSNALVAFNSRGTGSASAGLLKRLNVQDARPLGSSMKFCLIAVGEGDLYARFGETYEWDTAAGQAILEAAGGSVTTPAGVPLSYGHYERGFLNPHFVAWGRQPLWRTGEDVGSPSPSV